MKYFLLEIMIVSSSLPDSIPNREGSTAVGTASQSAAMLFVFCPFPTEEAHVSIYLNVYNSLRPGITVLPGRVR